MRRLCVTLLIMLGVLVAPTALSAGGSPTIASAQPVPLNARVTGGAKMGCDVWPYSGTEYWRVHLTGGAALVVDYGSLNGEGVQILIYRPDITDYTIGKADSSASGSTAGKDELRFRANVPGDWLIMLRGGCNQEYGYEMTVRVELKTVVRLAAPTRIRPKGTGTLRGRVLGVTSGTVSLQWFGNRRWHTFTTTSIASDGTFSYRATFNGKCGARWTNRAVYAGDEQHPAGISKPALTRANC